MTWDDLIKQELEKDYFQALVAFLKEEDKNHTVLPLRENRLQAFKLTPFDEVKVVIIGQDPYHNWNQAHGLAFSVEKPPFPPSLKNIFLELENDLGISAPSSGNLSSWAKQGVLLLNTVLTVRLHEPLSHQKQGWEQFTLEAVKQLNEKRAHLIFVLWGNHARKMKAYIDPRKQTIIESAHPSPLSAHRGFFNSKPFSKINQALKKYQLEPINWNLNYKS
ncbi:MAG: uracil-DNA glycosylase [Acholeplasmataceae bacterium]|nr:uracil-DNA glycosylase [Acholeplasmataceae bacterium]